LRTVASFAAIALWHPHRLHALSIGKAQQISDGAIAGNKLLLNLWSADREAQLAELPPQAERQGCEFFPA